MKNKIVSLAFFAGVNFMLAQEEIRPLSGNINLIYGDLKANQQVQSQNKPARSVQTATTLSLPFKDDFYYAYKSRFPDQNLWSDSSTYVNTGHAINPLSMGVATFDGLNKKGHPWTPNHLNQSDTRPADTLTSRPINLQTLGAQPLQPVDSVALTFYYEARGFGDSPELIDSLIVDFYKPLANQWVSRVWFQKGNPNANLNDSVFKRAYIRVTDTAYFHEGFRFRLRNKATPTGNYDHWHVDYVYLDKERDFVADTFYNDIALGYVPTPLLSRYSEMPWRQFKADEKAGSNRVYIRYNNNDSCPNMRYQYKVSGPAGLLEAYGPFDRGMNNFKKAGWSTYPVHAAPSHSYSLPAFSGSTSFTVEHMTDRGAVDFFPNNDTVIQHQNFRNHYAYDDGSAEAAYYVSGANGRMLMKFRLNYADTLTALRIYFNPIYSIVTLTNSYFDIELYSEAGGYPGIPLMIDSLKKPEYPAKGVNVMTEYPLNRLMDPGEYFIGIRQRIASGVGVGFDRNLNHMHNLFWNSGSGWNISQIPGSIMIHPVFGKETIPAAVQEIPHSETRKNYFYVFPNPSSESITVQSRSRVKTSYRLMNVIGQMIDQSNQEDYIHTINTSSLSNGVYFLVLFSDKQIVQQQKVIVQH